MRAALRRLHSPDCDLSTFKPDTDAFAVLVQLIVGPRDGPGEESFDVMVCSLPWLQEEIDAHGPLNGRHHLFIADWDLAKVENYFTRIVSSADGDSWQDVARQIGRHAAWEFEDYVE